MSSIPRWRAAIVTGAASGIGRCFADTLAAQGTSVGLLDVSADGLRAAAVAMRATGQRVETQVADVGNAADVRVAVDAFVAALGEVNLVIHCAAILGPGHF